MESDKTAAAVVILAVGVECAAGCVDDINTVELNCECVYVIVTGEDSNCALLNKSIELTEVCNTGAGRLSKHTVLDSGEISKCEVILFAVAELAGKTLSATSDFSL